MAWPEGLFLAVNGARASALDPVMLAATELGNAALAGLLLCLLLPFRRRAALAAILAVILAGLGADLLKGLFHTPRPSALPVGVMGGEVHVLGFPLGNDAFPSGHTATAFAAVLALRGALPRPGWAALLAGACLVGYSRMYIGAHWPIDVAGGALLGWGAAALARGPLSFLPAWAARGGVAADRAALAAGALCAVYLGWFERLLAFEFLFLRAVGVLGLAACLLLFARTFIRAGKNPPAASSTTGGSPA
jgi:undecaprenyl-diphosphatase